MRDATLWGLFVLILGSLACAGAPAPVDRHFRLEAPVPTAVLPAPSIAGTLVIDRPRGDALLAQRPIVYRRHPGASELAQYPYALWADAPTTLVQQGMAEHLTSAGLASQVLTADVGQHGEFMLRGRLVRLEHVLTGAPGVEVELELFLTHRGSGALVMQGRYSASRSVEGDELSPVVAALRDALGETLDAFVSDVATRTTSQGLLPVPAKRAP
jgi:ABC-type uncharacterized transport system auxiliary subunit